MWVGTARAVKICWMMCFLFGSKKCWSRYICFCPWKKLLNNDNRYLRICDSGVCDLKMAWKQNIKINTIMIKIVHCFEHFLQELATNNEENLLVFNVKKEVFCDELCISPTFMGSSNFKLLFYIWLKYFTHAVLVPYCGYHFSFPVQVGLFYQNGLKPDEADRGIFIGSDVVIVCGCFVAWDSQDRNICVTKEICCGVNVTLLRTIWLKAFSLKRHVHTQLSWF